MEERTTTTLDSTCKDVARAIRVMVVDSDKASLKEMENLMIQCDYDVTLVDNPIAAVQILKEQKDCFDLVVSNISIHEMDSLEFLDLVTNNLDIPVVLVLDEEEEEAHLKATLVGAKNVILKPLRSHELRNMLQHVLQHQNFKLKKRPREEADTVESKEDSPRMQTEGEPESPPLKSQKCNKRFIWTTELKKKFTFAVDQLGFENATPSKILEIMSVTELTRKQIGSRLQKHRIFWRKCKAEGRKDKGLSISGVLGSSISPSLANQVAQPLPPKVVLEAQCGSPGPFINMHNYYNISRADDGRVLGTYGQMKSTDPEIILEGIPSFMQEKRNKGNECIFQNPPIPFQVQPRFDATSTMWSSSSCLNHGDHELLQFQGYAFGQQAANDDQLNLGGTYDFDVALGSITKLMLEDFQFDDLHTRTSAAISHNVHEQSTSFVHPLAASETINEGINQIFQCSQNEFPGLGYATQPCTSSFEIDPMNSAYISLEMQDMPVIPLPVQMQNLGDLYGNSDPYLDNINDSPSINGFSDLERMLDLVIPPESQFQLSDLEGFFSVNDQVYGPDGGAVPLHQPNQVCFQYA